jgi:hypothetical protein
MVKFINELVCYGVVLLLGVVIVDGWVNDVSRIWWIPNRNAAALRPEV